MDLGCSRKRASQAADVGSWQILLQKSVAVSREA
jgi:hypothetical protein